MNTKIIGFLTLTVGLLLLLLLKQRFEKYTFSRTLGLYGQPEPAFCYETSPEPPYNVCRAGSLACSSHESWKDYEECTRKLQINNKYI